MLLRIGLEQGAVEKWIAKMDPADAVGAQRLLCKWLMQHGAVYFESDADHERFWREIRSAGARGSQAASVWFESWKALKDSRWRVAPDDVDLRLASPASRIQARHGDRPERSRIDGFYGSEVFQRLTERVASGRVPARTTRDDVWHHWLSPLTHHFDDVTIYDPFVGRQFLQGGARAQRNGVAACAWLVKHLAAAPILHTLTILTLAPSSSKQEVHEICEAAQRDLAAISDRGRLVQITVVVGARGGSGGAVTRARASERDLHDRHIRFSGGSRTEAAIVLAAGLDRLGQDPLAVDVHLQYRPEFKGARTFSIQDLREAEQAVLEATPQQRVDI